MAVMDSVDGASAQANVMQSDNKLRLAKSNLERENRLFKLGTPDVTQAETNLDQAHTHTVFSKDALDRTRQQAKIGGFNQKPLADAQNDLVSAQLTLAQDERSLLAAGRERDRTAKRRGDRGGGETRP